MYYSPVSFFIRNPLTIWMNCTSDIHNQQRIENIAETKLQDTQRKVIINLLFTPLELLFLHTQFFTAVMLHLRCKMFLQNVFAKYHCKYDLRWENCFALPKPKTNFLLKSVHYSAAKQWNSLPNRIIGNLGPFKKGLRSLEANDQKLLSS